MNRFMWGENLRRRTGKALYFVYFFKSIILFFVLVVASSCGPRDIHIKTLKQRLMEGEVYTLDADGQRLSTCLERDSDWQDLSVHENDYEALILNEQIVLVQSGYKNCHRVGSKVFIKNDRIKTNGSLGFVEVVGVSLLSVDQLQKERNLRVQGKAYSLKNDDVERVTARMQPRHQNVVHVVVAKYVPGTSSLEANIRQKQNVEGEIENELNLGAIITLDKEGELWASCGTEVWREFRIHHTKINAMKGGQLVALLNRGVKNCHQIGQVVEISTGNKSEKLGRVKVRKILVLNIETLKRNLEMFENEVTLQAINEDLAFLENRLRNENSKNVNVVFFEYLGEK